MKKAVLLIFSAAALLLTACGGVSKEPEDSALIECAEWLSSVTAEDIGYIDMDTVSPSALAPALNEAAGTLSRDGGEEAERWYSWSVSVWDAAAPGDGVYSSEDAAVRLTAWTIPGVVELRRGGETFYSDCPALYELVRASRDVPKSIDRQALAECLVPVSEWREPTLLELNTNPKAGIKGEELWQFSLEREYAGVPEGGRTRLYRQTYATICEEPRGMLYAGGVFLDSELRFFGFDWDRPYLAVTEKDGEAICTVNLGWDIFNGADEAEREENARKAVSDKINAMLLPEDAMVSLFDYTDDILTDIIKYASGENFTGEVIYDFRGVYLRYGTLKKLLAASDALAEQGFYLCVWDAYRPVSAQRRLWEVCPDPRYVANPDLGGSNHSRGNTVDVTLALPGPTGGGAELPSDFDDFSALADRDYSDVSESAGENARILEKAMTDAGFTPYSAEWWHYTDTVSYDISDYIPAA